MQLTTGAISLGNGFPSERNKDRMYLNPSQIILVEPVGPNSKVMQLILEQMEQKKQQ